MRTGQARKRDGNEASIVKALRQVGATVVRVSEKDAPDLLVGFKGRNLLMEIKAERGLMRANQAVWRSNWRGQAVTIRSVEEALEALNAI